MVCSSTLFGVTSYHHNMAFMMILEELIGLAILVLFILCLCELTWSQVNSLACKPIVDATPMPSLTGAIKIYILPKFG